jgi:hypothetical protein
MEDRNGSIWLAWEQEGFLDAGHLLRSVSKWKLESWHNQNRIGDVIIPVDGTNSSGFSAIPGCASNPESSTYFWSNTISSWGDKSPYAFWLDSYYGGGLIQDKRNKFHSVRCLQDQ